MANRKLLTFDEERALLTAAHAGDQAARAQLVDRNMGLVRSAANKYTSRHPQVSIDDMLQDGAIGLLDAIDTFNFRLQHRFSTHAWFQVQKAVQHCIWMSSAVRLPIDSIRTRKYSKTVAKVYSIEELQHDFIGEECDINEDGEAVEHIMRVRKAIDALPEPWNKLWWNVIVERKTCDDASIAVGLAKSWMRNRVTIGKELLVERIRKLVK